MYYFSEVLTEVYDLLMVSRWTNQYRFLIKETKWSANWISDLPWIFKYEVIYNKLSFNEWKIHVF